MSNKILFTKDQLIDKVKELKKRELEYNKIIQQKPNIESPNGNREIEIEKWWDIELRNRKPREG